MTFDLTKLTGGQIALLTACATLLAALTSGMFAVIAARINGSFAKRIARANSHREYRRELVKPVLETIDEECLNLRRAARLLVCQWNEPTYETLALELLRTLGQDRTEDKWFTFDIPTADINLKREIEAYKELYYDCWNLAGDIYYRADRMSEKDRSEWFRDAFIRIDRAKLLTLMTNTHKQRLKVWLAFEAYIFQ